MLERGPEVNRDPGAAALDLASEPSPLVNDQASIAALNLERHRIAGREIYVFLIVETGDMAVMPDVIAVL